MITVIIQRVPFTGIISPLSILIGNYKYCVCAYVYIYDHQSSAIARNNREDRALIFLHHAQVPSIYSDSETIAHRFNLLYKVIIKLN